MPRTLTNNHGLHKALYESMKDLTWYGGHGENRFRSVTGLINPPYMMALEDEHEDEIVEDAINGIWRIVGSAVHEIVRRGATKLGLTEDRMKMEVLGKTITGGYDLLWEDEGLLKVDDFKFPGIMRYVYGMKDKAAGKRSLFDEWSEQLNLYVLMLRLLGFKPDFASDCVIFRDWMQGQADREADYPPKQVIIPAEIWPKKRQMEFAEHRVQLHVDAVEKGCDPCSEEERWQRPATYAVLKPGGKKATRVLDTEEEAYAYIAEKKIKAGVLLRPGKCSRCRPEYCNVTKWCQHFVESSLPF